MKKKSVTMENAEVLSPLDRGLFVSIVIPVYLSSASLPQLSARLSKTLGDHFDHFEIVFVDDGSPDDSLAVMRDLARGNSSIVPIESSRNQGQHKAILKGLSCCRGDWAVIMDSDLQDAPEDVPMLLKNGLQGFGAVFAARQGAHESPFNLLTSFLFKSLLHLLCGLNPKTGTFVAVSRPMIDRLLAMHGPYPYIPGMIHCAGLAVASVPVHRSKRPVGKSSYNFRGRLRLMWRALSWVAAWKWMLPLKEGLARRAAAMLGK